MFGAAIGAGEQRILPIERDGADRSFDGIVVDLDAPVLDEAGQTFPARQGVADRLGELAFLADQAEFCAQPLLECIGERPAFLLPDDTPLLGAAATDVLLDGVKFGDVPERLAGNGRGARRGEFVELAPHTRPLD